MKNCDRGLENAARGRRPRAAFSREFRPLTSQEKNNEELFFKCVYMLINNLTNQIKNCQAITAHMGSFPFDQYFEVIIKFLERDSRKLEFCSMQIFEPCS